MAPGQSRIAMMEQSSPTQIPTMTPRKITIEGLQAFEMACWAYFRAKEILEEEQVERIAWGFQDPHIQKWYITNQARIGVMDFAEYMGEMHNVWLPSDWARKAWAQILSAHQGDWKFWDWALEPQNKNTWAVGTA